MGCKQSAQRRCRNLSVVSVHCLCNLCEKFLAFLQPSRKFMNNPG
jgi:hypothetical protein